MSTTVLLVLILGWCVFLPLGCFQTIRALGSSFLVCTDPYEIYGAVLPELCKGCTVVQNGHTHYLVIWPLAGCWLISFSPFLEAQERLGLAL